jgi:hypothetical protein
MAEKGLIDRLTEQVGGNRELALNILRDRGDVTPGTEKLTTQGRRKDSLGAEGRALERAVKYGGGNIWDYQYDPETNRTRKQK